MIEQVSPRQEALRTMIVKGVGSKWPHARIPKARTPPQTQTSKFKSPWSQGSRLHRVKGAMCKRRLYQITVGPSLRRITIHLGPSVSPSMGYILWYVQATVLHLTYYNDSVEENIPEM